MPSADDIIAKYRSNVQNLKTVLENEPDVHRVRALLSEILAPVVIGKDAATGGLWAEMEKPAELLLEAATGGSLGLVEGARIDRLLTSIRRIRLSP